MELIPTVVAEVVRRRFQRLPEDVQTLLRVAAVIGRDFDLDVIAASAGLNSDDAFELLETAVVTRSAVCVAPGSYRFEHGLVRDAIYGELTATRRSKMHGVVGRAIESTFAHDLSTQYGQLARHFRLAGDRERAILYSVQAAVQPRRTGHSPSRWRTASKRRAMGARARRANRARLGLRLAHVQYLSGRLQQAVVTLAETLVLADQADDIDLLVEIALEFGHQGFWTIPVEGERWTRAIFERHLQRSTDERVSAALSIGLATCLVDLPDPDRRGPRRERAELIIEATDVARRLGDDELLGVGLGVQSALPTHNPMRVCA